jgi:hypothetical protein
MMITHEGFVFMTPVGSYVKRVNVLGHSKDKVAFVNVFALDAATLFPTDKPPSDSRNQDWSAVTAGRKHLIAIPASTRQTTELNL